MKSKSERIMEAVNKICGRNVDEDESGLLGFCIRENDDSPYSETGNSVLFMFNQHPEHAELLDNMLIAVCGCGIESLLDKMDRERDYYNYL